MPATCIILEKDVINYIILAMYMIFIHGTDIKKLKFI